MAAAAAWFSGLSTAAKIGVGTAATFAGAAVAKKVLAPKLPPPPKAEASLLRDLARNSNQTAAAPRRQAEPVRQAYRQHRQRARTLRRDTLQTSALGLQGDTANTQPLKTLLGA